MPDDFITAVRREASVILQLADDRDMPRALAGQLRGRALHLTALCNAERAKRAIAGECVTRRPAPTNAGLVDQIAATLAGE